ncbi:MAG: hypothetical protein AAFU60_07835, partial [Bacteroidota bacterium]
QNTEFVRYTMVNGRMYDAATMNEIGNRERNRLPFYFEQEGSGNAYPFFIQSNSHMRPSCHCQQ